MVTIFIKPGLLFRFPSLKIAETWMNEHPEEYDFDKDNLEIFTDREPADSVKLEGTLFIKQCIGCNKFIKFEVLPKEYIEDVICPNCGVHLGPQ